MPKPPKTPPSSDIEGVDQDWRTGLPDRNAKADPGKQLENARKQSIGRPDSGVAGPRPKRRK
jgi:hypothetical protein